jgi:hypothetical protein
LIADYININKKIFELWFLIFLQNRN